uniref:SAC3/GANP/THP3 conserved domain-containing protein n=2 Tax=Clastoptera arizonana TaxID=38151 RepID=A0A1B6DSY2_9HEMI
MAIRGICMDMCPKQEIILRQREGLVHILEQCDDNHESHSKQYKKIHRQKIKVDHNRMVKAFQRSAAGRNMLCPEDLRPPDVLFQTVVYLIERILKNTYVKWPIVYNFITDRLRAVRQDMVIQQPTPEERLKILVPIVRFHIYSSYRLCTESVHTFDPKLNNTHLIECLASLIYLFDLDNTDSTTRWEIEAVNLLWNLGDSYTLTRFISLSKTSNHQFLKMAKDISFAYLRNNYNGIFNIFTKLPVLLQMVLASHLPLIRRNALRTMNNAYSSKNLTYPLSKLKSLLKFNNDEEALNECKYYGLKVDNGNIHFLRETFDHSVKLNTMKKLDLIDSSLRETEHPLLLLQCSWT